MIILIIVLVISNMVRDDCLSESKHLEGQLGWPVRKGDSTIGVGDK